MARRKKEPVTEVQFENALEKLGYEVRDHGDRYSVCRKDGSGRTNLEAGDYYAALFEAWHLVKP
jgi:hypothetical protein